MRAVSDFGTIGTTKAPQRSEPMGLWCPSCQCGGDRRFGPSSIQHRNPGAATRASRRFPRRMGPPVLHLRGMNLLEAPDVSGAWGRVLGETTAALLGRHDLLKTTWVARTVQRPQIGSSPLPVSTTLTQTGSELGTRTDPQPSWRSSPKQFVARTSMRVSTTVQNGIHVISMR